MPFTRVAYVHNLKAEAIYTAFEGHPHPSKSGARRQPGRGAHDAAGQQSPLNCTGLRSIPPCPFSVRFLTHI